MATCPAFLLVTVSAVLSFSYGHLLISLLWLGLEFKKPFSVTDKGPYIPIPTISNDRIDVLIEWSGCLFGFIELKTLHRVYPVFFSFVQPIPITN